MTQTDPFSTPERRALANTVAAFTRKHISPHIGEWERDGRLPRDLHVASAEAGLAGLDFDPEVGGSGGDLVDTTLVIEGILKHGGSGGLIASLFTHGIALPHIVDEARRRRSNGDADGGDYLLETFVRPTLAGRLIGALAVTEPDGGSDVAHLRTIAVPDPTDPDTLIVNGSKAYITSSPRADFITVAVRTGGDGAAGVSLLVIPTDSEGFTVTRELDKMGWRCSDTGELSFVDVPVPRRNLLGDGLGFTSLAEHFITERLTLAVTGYATAQRCLDLSIEYCRNRETFGRPLISRQVVRHDLVEMNRRIDVARVYTRQVAARHAAGENVTLEALIAKQTAVDACDFVVDRAVQLHGGAGYMTGTEVEMHYRDARILGIGGGANEVMADLAGKLLGL